MIENPIPPRPSWAAIKKVFPIRSAELPILSIGTPLDSAPASNFHYKMDYKVCGNRINTAKHVILHYTAGSNNDPVTCYKALWNVPSRNPNKASACFNIGRTGRIAGVKNYKKIYSNHYGNPTWGNTPSFNANSIGIEIESYGFLEYDLNDKNFYNNYNSIVKRSEVTQTKKPYRGNNMWQCMTDVQISAVANLIIAIWNDGGIDKTTTFLSNCVGTSRYNILFPEQGLRTIPPPGIITHGSGRDNKIDTFPQTNLLEMLDELPTLIKNNPKTHINWTL
jgi:hypothetical protein